MKKSEIRVLSQEELCPGIFSLWLKDPELAREARPGQFLNLYCKNGSQLLPRPISICELCPQEGTLRLVYRPGREGTGTRFFTSLKEGDLLDVMGPLGNGFPLVEGKRVLLVGGGIGVPPLVGLAKALSPFCEVISCMGYQSDLFLTQELERYGRVLVATMDGSAGVKGTVLDALRGENKSYDLFYACGPMGMLKALAGYAREVSLPGYVSMEERMACGLGACLACVCRSKEEDSHFHTHTRRVCKDGPVFSLDEVEL